MRKLAGYSIAAWMLLAPLTGVAQQACRSESEIPSSTPSGRFTDHSNGTVTDGGTGLMWARCAAGLSGASCDIGSALLTADWQDALDHAAGSSLAGYTDWRLPTVTELYSIVEQRCINPAINAAVFPNTPATYFWSASPTIGRSGDAWLVVFSSGYSYTYSRNGRNLLVRLVRAGQ